MSATALDSGSWPAVQSSTPSRRSLRQMSKAIEAERERLFRERARLLDELDELVPEPDIPPVELDT